MLADRDIQILLLIDGSPDKFAVITADGSRADSCMAIERRGLLDRSVHLVISEVKGIEMMGL